MIKHSYYSAANESLRDPEKMPDAQVLRAFLESDLKKFLRVLGTIIDTVKPEKHPHKIFAEIMYKAASLGRQQFCDALLPYAERQDYIDGLLNYASMEGNVEAMDYLVVECGANLHSHEDQPLRSAIVAQQQASVDYLQERGCDLAVAMNANTLKAINEMAGCKGALVFAFLRIQDGWEGHGNGHAPDMRPR